MKTKLITALRVCARALENGTFDFRWTVQARCNCGIVVCALTGKSPTELEPLLPREDGLTWQQMAGRNCPMTGAPTHEIFRQLFEAGLSAKDITELEYLASPVVLARMGKFYVKRSKLIDGLVGKKEMPVDFHSKFFAARYFRAWAELLEEEGALDVAEPVLSEPALWAKD